ncbi:RNA polymerase sigma factor, sigma-70 family [Ruaniaceae bacterium KH17]|nr:RNA polymerase sigma factor, sigma-70 family [Ruaniaceae bacterium KH17]
MSASPIDLVDLSARALTDYRAGDGAAMRQLVESVTPMLWHLARAQGLTPRDAEDVVQQTWLRFVEHAERIDDPRGALKWLMTTTRREAWRLAKRAPREATVPDLLEETPSEADALEEVLAAGTRATLWHHVRALSERCQHLLRIIAFADRPDYAAIADALGMPVGSIGPTRGRCLAALRAALHADPTFDLGGAS